MVKKIWKGKKGKKQRNHWEGFVGQERVKKNADDDDDDVYGKWSKNREEKKKGGETITITFCCY